MQVPLEWHWEVCWVRGISFDLFPHCSLQVHLFLSFFLYNPATLRGKNTQSKATQDFQGRFWSLHLPLLSIISKSLGLRWFCISFICLSPVVCFFLVDKHFYSYILKLCRMLICFITWRDDIRFVVPKVLLYFSGQNYLEKNLYGKLSKIIESPVRAVAPKTDINHKQSPKVVGPL